MSRGKRWLDGYRNYSPALEARKTLVVRWELPARQLHFNVSLLLSVRPFCLFGVFQTLLEALAHDRGRNVSNVCTFLALLCYTGCVRILHSFHNPDPACLQ